MSTASDSRTDFDSVEDTEHEYGNPGTEDVVDPAIGRPRVLDRKCVTCIYRPGNRMDPATGAA